MTRPRIWNDLDRRTIEITWLIAVIQTHSWLHNMQHRAHRILAHATVRKENFLALWIFGITGNLKVILCNACEIRISVTTIDLPGYR